MTHNEGKSQSTEADSEITQIIDSLEKDIKTVVITIFYMFKNIEGLNVVSGDIEDIQKDSNQTSRDKNTLK